MFVRRIMVAAQETPARSGDYAQMIPLEIGAIVE
jgi:hypothetical protein